MPVRRPPESVMRFVAGIDDDVRSTIGDQLVATVLHGSAALGGFVEGRSDVDVLLLVDPPSIPPHDLVTVVERLRASAERWPGVGLELSVVSATAAADPGPPWPFILHVSTRVDEDKTVLGHDREGDRDLLMHYAVCRTGGISVTGRPSSELFGVIERDQILEYLHDELTWARENADATYGVLNACRAWQFAVTGQIVSKLDGAAWALRAGGPAAVITAAVAAQTGSGSLPVRQDADELITMVQSVIDSS